MYELGFRKKTFLLSRLRMSWVAYELEPLHVNEKSENEQLLKMI